MKQRRLALLLIVATGIALSFIAWRTSRPDAATLWGSVQMAAAQQQWERALGLAEAALQAGSASAHEYALAGSVALKAGRLQRAEELFGQIDDRQPGAADAWRRVGKAWLQANRAIPAERAFRRTLQLDPSRHEARLELAELLRLSGRYFELEPLMRELIAQGDCPSPVLFAVAWPDKIWLDDADRRQIEAYLQADPDGDWIGLAAVLSVPVTADSRSRAIQFLQNAACRPKAPSEALARWGTELANAGLWDQWPDWERALTAEALSHPQIWYLRGLWQLQHGETPSAIRCFWEALERGPFHYGATYQLARWLPRSSAADLAELYEKRAGQLAQLRQQVIFGKGAGGFPGPDVLQSIIRLLTDLGRHWEALGWCQLAAARHPELRWPAEQLSARRQRLTPDVPWIDETARLSQRVRLDQFPRPDFGDARPSQERPALPAASSEIRFADVAEEMGVTFRFDGGSHAGSLGYMYEISAGGIGIIDYDRDDWPDVYLTNGGPLPHLPRDSRVIDRLYRNQQGIAVRDVTAAATLQAAGYGQGVAVGDINADGFPDLFVTNIGPNQLWVNQGDGTFVDVTAAAGLSGSVWTMSAAMGDFNGDSLADLFEVNYLSKSAAADPLTTTCQRDGVTVMCRITMFPSEPDRLWRNLGDGRLQDDTRSSGVAGADGRGIGVVTARVEGQHQLSIYVANDMQPNSFWSNITAARGAAPRFLEQATPLGLAFSGDGLPQASMGIAVADVDGEGSLDLYVTNFVSEGSNLFVRDSSGTFTDRSRTYGLYEHSTLQMGWGAQFLDADLDGWPDLVVANGHLEDYSRWNIVSRMPAQVFRNRAGSRFELLTADAVGSYFAQQHFGRALARFDGNRDGREDVLVTHVDAPLAWLQNRTRSAGRSLSIRLAGTLSERDAIGAQLTAVVQGRTLHRQLTAGDGFQVSNQRQVVFGLGSATSVERLQVEWPSGLTQQFTDVPADREIVLREGDDHWYELPRAGLAAEAPVR